MKTADELIDEMDCTVFNEIDGYLYSHEDCVNLMKEYAKQISEQALKDASESATLNIESMYGFGSFDVANYTDGDGDTITVNKESILNTEIKTP